MFAIVTRHHRATVPMSASWRRFSQAPPLLDPRRSADGPFAREPDRAEETAMTGPWKDRRFDARAWRMPAPHDANDPEAPGSAVEGTRLTVFVLGYVVAVPAVLAMLIALLEHGW
jgi:hypothetical protein